MTVNHSFFKLDSIRRELDENIKDSFINGLSDYFSLQEVVEFNRVECVEQWESIRDDSLVESEWINYTSLDWKGFPLALWDRLVEVLECYNCWKGDDDDLSFKGPAELLTTYVLLTVQEYGDDWFDEFVAEAKEQIRIKRVQDRAENGDLDYELCNEWQTCPCSNAALIRRLHKEKEDRDKE